MIQHGGKMGGDGTPALLALDWGTSSLRAFLMDASGVLLASRHSAHGVLNLPGTGPDGFESALAAIAGDWLAYRPQLPVVAGGMVGSAQGWKEAPYVRSPASVADLAGHAVRIEREHGGAICVAPGIQFIAETGAPDVMRGEEIQIAGALDEAVFPGQDFNAILPGTHSKWVEVSGGRIERFATYLTGELFAVLRNHSILGRLMPVPGVSGDGPVSAAFCRGLVASEGSQAGDWLHRLFSVRTLGLTGQLPHADLAEYLSGLLIGYELRSGLRRLREAHPVILIGERALCSRYAEAFRLLGGPAIMQMDNTAPAGLFRFAVALGLVAKIERGNA